MAALNRYLIVADDFTGANDTGMQVCRFGFPVQVVFSGADIDGTQSCVLDTESRSLSPAEAFQKVAFETEKIPFASFRHVIKKVDSTLRGNIGAETAALAQWYKPELVVFAPAFPDMGRTTIRGIHRLNGTPVSQTVLAKDIISPIQDDDIQRIMAGAFGEKVVHVDLETVRSGNFNLEEGKIFSFDAAANTDLELIVRRILASDKRVLWAGCTALADALLHEEIYVPPALAVVASLSPVTRGQVLFAERQGVSLIKVPLYAIIEKSVLTGNPITERVAREAITLLNEGRDVILLPSSTYSTGEYKRTDENARRAGISPEAMALLVQRTMGRITLSVLEQAKISGLFLSGGDTAISCLKSIGIPGSHITITDEIAIGIPIMHLAGGKYDGLKVVTKAGTFGNEDAIVFGLRKLKSK